MRNLLLLLILISGLVAGYFIGDYRGKSARQALEAAIKTGEKLDTERRDAIAKLEMELRSIDAKHRLALEESRKEYDSKAAEWQREKAGLDDKIRRLNVKRVANDAELKILNEKLGSASGAEKERLEREIERLRITQGLLAQQIEGNACLKIQVPQSVHDALALKMTTDIGGTR